MSGSCKVPMRRHPCCSCWLCQDADLDCSSPWLQFSYKTQRARMKMTAVNHSPSTVRAVKSTTLKVLCRGAYAGQHINYIPLELVMSKKEKREELQTSETCTVEPWEHVGGGEFIAILILQKSTASYLPATNKFILTLPVWVDHTASVNSSLIFLDLTVFKLIFPTECLLVKPAPSQHCCFIFTHLIVPCSFSSLNFHKNSFSSCLILEVLFNSQWVAII